MAWEEQSIESKRTLLAHMRSQPKHLTMECFLCLIEWLGKGGWRLEDQLWQKDDSNFRIKLLISGNRQQIQCVWLLRLTEPLSLLGILHLTPFLTPRDVQVGKTGPCQSLSLEFLFGESLAGQWVPE